MTDKRRKKPKKLKMIITFDVEKDIGSVKDFADDLRMRVPNLDIQLSKDFPIPSIPIDYLKLWENEHIDHIIAKYKAEHGNTVEDVADNSDQIGITDGKEFFPLVPGNHTVIVTKKNKFYIIGE